MHELIGPLYFFFKKRSVFNKAKKHKQIADHSNFRIIILVIPVALTANAPPTHNELLLILLTDLMTLSKPQKTEMEP